MDNIIFLAQSDTTAGFLSKNAAAINNVKKAPKNKALLKEYAYFKYLDSRIPTKFRSFVRNAKKTSFILPNKLSFRVIKEPLHREFLQRFKSLYSSSANENLKRFDIYFGYKNCDVIVKDMRGIFESKSSKILKINNIRMKKVR